MTSKNEAAHKAAPRSHVRQVLTSKLTQRTHATAEAQKVQRSITRLNAVGEEAAQLKQKLATAESVNAETMKAWAVSGANAEIPRLAKGLSMLGSKLFERSFRSLCRCSDRVHGRGAAVKNLFYNASRSAAASA